MHVIPRVKGNLKQCFQEINESIINTPFLMSVLYLRSPTRKESIKVLHPEYPSSRGSLAQALCREKGFLDLHWAKLETQALGMLKAYSDQVADTAHPALPTAGLTLQNFFVLFFPKVHNLKKCILCRTPQIFTTIYVTTINQTDHQKPASIVNKLLHPWCNLDMITRLNVANVERM